MDKRPYLYASIWHCEDGVCACYQPRIERFTWRTDYPVWRIEELWAGTYASASTDRVDFEMLKAELRDEMERMEIPVVEEWETNLIGVRHL